MLSDVLSFLFMSSNNTEQERLKSFLAKKYGGEVALFYKGREAITQALEIMALPQDSEIAMNGFTCVAVFNAIRTAGYEPICLDLSETGGLNFTAQTLEKAIEKNKKIKAVIIQNTLGYPCEIEKIEAVCEKNKLLLIEDLAHCVGTTYADGREAGTVGDIICLSFSQDKVIDAISGGALVVRNKEYMLQQIKRQKVSRYQEVKDRLYPMLTYKIRWLYQFGLGKQYHFLLKKLGLMSRIMDESFYQSYALPSLHAKIAYVQYKKLYAQLQHRRTIADIYATNLSKNLLMSDLEKTKQAVSLSTNLRFPIFVKNRDKLVTYLQQYGVFIADIWYKDVSPDCPSAVADANTIINLPTHINISKQQAKEIAERITQWQQLQ